MPFQKHTGTLNIILKMAKIFGLFRYPTSPPSLYVAVTLFRTLNFVVTTLVILANIADFFKNIDNLSEVSYNIGYILPMITTSLKAATMLRKQKEFRSLIETVHGPVTKLGSSSDPGVINLRKKATFYQNVDFFAFCFATTSVCLTGLVPMKTILSTRQLMIRSVFPFDEKPYPIFEIVYAVQYYGLIVECIFCVIFDPAVMGLVRWISFQMSVLQHNFQHCETKFSRAGFVNYDKMEIGPIDPKAKVQAFISFTQAEADAKEDNFLVRFSQCVKHHRRLIELLNNFNSLFGLILFAQIGSDCLLTCVGLFQMAQAIRKKRNILRDLVMLGSGLIHLLYWSIYGNLLIIEHEKLSKSIYCCGWENHNGRVIKQIVIFGLYQSLKPMVITAGYFFVLSMETYLSVIQKAYSYFAILNTMIDG